ncbi:MAG: hypothetical protein ACPGN3_11765 [Opitutales bacterium]
MKIAALLALISTSLMAYQPKDPESVHLDPENILPVYLNQNIDTLLLFPEPIEMVSGVGFSEDWETSDIHYRASSNSYRLVLKPKKEVFSAYLKVSIDGDVFVLHCLPSETPSTVIRFRPPIPVLEPFVVTAEIDLPELEDLLRKPTRERQFELMRLTYEEEVLRKQIPSLFDGYSSKVVNKSHTSGHFEVTFEKLGRFAHEDALVVVANVSFLPGYRDLDPTWKLRLRIGPQKVFPFNEIHFIAAPTSGHAPLQFVAILVGDGFGGPGHYSLENDFHIEFIENGVF